MNSTAFSRFLRETPKAELHLHFEGAVPWRLVREWSTADLPETPAWWDRDHRFESFADFLLAMQTGWKGLVTDMDRLSTAARALFADLAEQKVVYLEMSFGLGAYVEPVEVVAATFKRAAPEEMTLRVIGGISRDLDPQWMRDVAAEAVEAPSVDGIDLHGNEAAGSLGAFVDLYHAAQHAGKITKAHAGEFGGPDVIRHTLDVLQVRRIEHGITAAMDPELVDRLVSNGVTLDVCPWSNVKLGAVPSMADHPLKQLAAAGVRTTVGTDDPTTFGQTLTDELGWAHTEIGLDADEVVEIVRSGFHTARLDPETRKGWLEQVDAAYERAAGSETS